MPENEILTTEHLLSKIDDLKSKGQDIKDLAVVELIEFLKIFISPSFAAIPRREVDILVFNTLRKLGVIDKNPDLFDLISSLKITRTKARNLIYESNLRESSVEKLDFELRQLLVKPRVIASKNKERIHLEVENPLLIDHIKRKMKGHKEATDGSFSPELIKMSSKAFALLLEDVLTKEEKSSVKAVLVRESALKDKSIKGYILAAVKTVGKKVVGDVAEELVNDISEFLKPLIEGAGEAVFNKISELAIGTEEAELEVTK